MKNKRIVITKTPLRISFLGGGTDIANFYKKNSGMVVSSTINKFIYVIVKEHGALFFRNYRLNYSRTENKNKLDLIQNDIIRETLKIIRINKPLYISSISDIPANSGLGSSSAFTVGLIKALYEFKNIKISPYKIAELACKIEINRVKSPIGKQDQYATSIGGFNSIYFHKNSVVKIKKINKIKIINKIFDNSLLIWVGKTRKTNHILNHQNNRLNLNINNLNLIKNLAKKFKNEILKNRFSLIGLSQLLRQNWELKKKLSNKISSKRIQKIFNKAEENGATGGKILGAGGGGFIFFIIKKSRIEIFKKKMIQMDKKISFTQCRYCEKGAEVLLSKS